MGLPWHPVTAIRSTDGYDIPGAHRPTGPGCPRLITASCAPRVKVPVVTFNLKPVPSGDCTLGHVSQGVGPYGRGWLWTLGTSERALLGDLALQAAPPYIPPRNEEPACGAKRSSEGRGVHRSPAFMLSS